MSKPWNRILNVTKLYFNTEKKRDLYFNLMELICMQNMTRFSPPSYLHTTTVSLHSPSSCLSVCMCVCTCRRACALGCDGRSAYEIALLNPAPVSALVIRCTAPACQPVQRERAQPGVDPCMCVCVCVYMYSLCVFRGLSPYEKLLDSLGMCLHSSLLLTIIPGWKHCGQTWVLFKLIFNRSFRCVLAHNLPSSPICYSQLDKCNL